MPLSWLAYVALVPLGVALEQRARMPRAEAGSGFGLGTLAGFVFFLAGLHWIAFLKPVAVTISWIMYPSWVAGSAYLALYPGLACWAALSFRRRLGVPVAIGLPLCWLAAEKIRSMGEMGFPWLSIGYSQWSSHTILQWASIGGVALVGAFVVAINGCLLATIFARTAKSRVAAIVTLVVLAITAYVGGKQLWPGSDEGHQGPRVALVQGNVPGEVKWSGKHQAEVLGKFLVLTRSALPEHPDLVIWPETATGSYLRRDLPSLVALMGFVDSTNVPILAGYPDYQPRPDGTYRLSNAAAVFAPRVGLLAQYEKMHLVPFGERLPFQWLIPALGKLDFGQAEFAPGDSLVLLEAAGQRACVLVCFESIFADGPRRARARGATLLVNITNDEWFGRTGALYQHAAMSVFRAVETRLPLARCANTGLTFFVDRAGRIYGSGGVFVERVVVDRLDHPGPAPPFVRWGDWPGAVVLALALAGVLACAVRAKNAPTPLHPESS